MLQHSDFPSDFVFGAATSAYQIEGHGFGGAGRTHWDSFAAKPGNVVRRENGSIACEHYHRYREDLDFLQGFDAYRFSTSWARILPEGRGQVNPEGLDFYDRLVDAVLERGLAPYLTLYHWELPAALADQGGWTNRDIVGWFGDYAEIVMERIGDRIASVATINEPWCVSYLSHFLGQHAPGLRDIAATARAVHHVLLAHGEALGRLRALGRKNIGIVLNFDALQARDDSPDDLAATKTYDAIMNRLFIQPLITGSYPDAAMAGLGPHMPENWQDDMALIRQPLDWLGVNYYMQNTVAAVRGAAWPGLRFTRTNAAKTQMGWDIYPEGLHETLSWLAAEFTGDLPLYVTENGMAWNDAPVGGKVMDPERVNYISDHLDQVHRALQQGLNIRGFFYWSLLDNYEWALGYEKRFGLIHVDFETQTRTPKLSYQTFRKAFARNL